MIDTIIRNMLDTMTRKASAGDKITVAARVDAELIRRLDELAEWGLELQRRHLELALEGIELLAERFEPAAPRWG